MFRDLLGQAYQAMRHNRRRTALTMLGMAWGIATVVLLLAYGADPLSATDHRDTALTAAAGIGRGTGFAHGPWSYDLRPTPARSTAR